MKRNVKTSQNIFLRSAMNYAWISVLLVLFAHVYRIFGHGITSASMENAHLYTLGPGFAFMWLLGIAQKHIGIRLNESKFFFWFFDLYNTGVALMASRGIVKGILDIAGYVSPKVAIFSYIAVFMFAMSALSLILCIIDNIRLKNAEE